MDIAAETTREVVTRRRVGLLARLGQGLGEVQTVEEVVALGRAVLASDTEDIVAVDMSVLADAPPDDGRLHVDLTPEGPVARMTLGAVPGGHLVFVGRLSQRQPLGRRLQDLVRVVASALRQAIRRVRIRDAERALADAQRGMAEVLQRSLLTTPLQPDHLQIAVRCWPATREAQVGGDWYDSFLRPDGALMLVLGDVAGHDRDAVAPRWGRCATCCGASPTRSTGRPRRSCRRSTTRCARCAWTSSPPRSWPRSSRPTSRRAKACAPCAGPAPAIRRRCWSRPTASVVFYTDGLIERRDRSLDEGFARLVGALQNGSIRDAEALCERLAELREECRDDDVALLVLTAHPEP
jgi:hypothetical protein